MSQFMEAFLVPFDTIAAFVTCPPVKFQKGQLILRDAGRGSIASEVVLPEHTLQKNIK